MLGVFLRCLLFNNALGPEDDVKLEDHYTGKECDIRLNAKDYFQGITSTHISDLNGEPHYLWGDNVNTDSLLYCARITSQEKFLGTVSYKLSVPQDVLKGEITGVQVIDRKAPGKGGYVHLYKGGVGQTFAILSFKSRTYKSTDYVVIIFGIPQGQRRL